MDQTATKMCAIESEVIVLQRAVDRYDGIDISFAGSQEGRLLKVVFCQAVRHAVL